LITFDDGYRDVLTEAWPLLQAYGFTASVFIVPPALGDVAPWEPEGGERARLLTSAEVAELAEQGIEFGSHTLTHPQLTALGSEEVTRELAESRLALRERLGLDAAAIAYPYGDVDASVQQLAWACGYEFGLTTRDGTATFEDDLLELPRIEIQPADTVEGFAEKLGG
jgi:peptidoglycan/xylan/chitin deacetylase (PgdA/CDA1 family)